MPSGRVLVRPESTTVPAANITPGDWVPVKANTDVLAALRFDPAHPSYGAVRGAVSTTQRAANTAAINLAASDAATAGGTLIIKGSYEVNPGVQVKSHLDGTDSTLTVYNTGAVTALLLGSRTAGSAGVTRNKRMIAPRVIQGSKAATGWTGTDVGVEVSNLYTCALTFTEVTNFSTGVWFSAYGTGNVMNTVDVGFVYNNKIGHLLAAGDAGGWVNQNTFMGGQIGINSSEGTGIPGTRYIQISNAAFPINGNIWIGTDVESAMPELRVLCYGPDNTWIYCRWEKIPAIARFEGANARGNRIEGGNSADNVTIQEVSGAYGNRVSGRGGERFDASGGTTGVFIHSNSGSGVYPVFVVMDPGQSWLQDPATQYRWRVSANQMEVKRAGDAFPTWRLTHDTGGTMAWGTGTAEPTITFGRFSTSSLRASGRLLATGGLGSGGVVSSAPVGSPTKKVPFYDDSGTLVGYIGLYAS